MRVFLTPSIIMSIASDTSTYNQGHSLYENKSVTDLTFIRQGAVYVLSSKVDDILKHQRVYIVFSETGEISSFQCNCDSSRVWKGACKHICATLFTLLYESRDNEKQRISSKSASNILSALEKISLIDQSQNIVFSNPEEKISIEPTISFYQYYRYERYSRVNLSFRIGSNRKYIIKNIDSFLDAVNNGEVVSYGKNLAFIHSPENFDDKSKKLLELMRNEAENAGNYIRAYVDSGITRLNLQRDMPLSSKGMDSFFELYLGEIVDADVSGRDSLLFSKEEAPVSYKLTETDESVTMSGHNDFIQLQGYRYKYLIIENAVYRIDSQRLDIINAIEKELKPENSYNVQFSKQNIDRFVNFVLPVLKRQNLADTTAIDIKYDIRELVKKVYLDIDKNHVTVKVLFCYEDCEINALEKEPQQMFRDLLSENALKKVLEQYGFSEDKNGLLYVLKDTSMIYNFYKYGVEQLKCMADVFATDDFARKSQRTTYKKSAFGIRIKGELLEISPEGSEFSMHELMDIVEAYNSKKKFHRLRDGRFVDLTEGELSETAEFLEALDISGRDIHGDSIKIPANRAMYVDNLISGENGEFFNRDEAFKKIIADFANDSVKEFLVPDKLSSILRGYQKDGFKWLALLSHYHFGGILADDMGLGKTVQVISLIVYAKETEGRSGVSLVVAPTSLIYNWEREFLKFAPQVKTLVVSGTSKKQKIEVTDDIDAIITTYDILKRDLDLFTGRDYIFVIADEAQNIKNPETQNAKAVKKLIATARFALTGTPIENSLSELWSIFDFVMPGYLRGYSKFAKDYETPITKSKNPEKAERLKKQIAPFILRRVKKDVLSEIPDKLETNLYAEMTEEQRKVYTAYHLRAKGELDTIFDKNMMKESRIKILSFITRLRQICCHPGVFMDSYTGGSGKLYVVMETIRNCIDSGHRMLLFSQFTSILEIVIDELVKEGIPYFYIDGATPAKRRNDMADKFNNGENPIFLISLKAGGTGLNLTGADIVIHFDPWWNPAVMDQASDRAHRIGQKNVVQVFNVVAKDTIEEKIIALQEKKRDLIDLVITDGANLISKLTSEEIYELFV